MFRVKRPCISLNICWAPDLASTSPPLPQLFPPSHFCIAKQVFFPGNYKYTRVFNDKHTQHSSHKTWLKHVVLSLFLPLFCFKTYCNHLNTVCSCCLVFLKLKTVNNKRFCSDLPYFGHPLRRNVNKPL